VTKRTTSEWTLWVVAVSCALHVTEEYLTGWHAWAVGTLGIVMPTVPFLMANAVLVAVAFRLASLGWSQPTLSLVIPSATLVNAVFLHILPTIVQGRIAPGLFTAAFLYVPFSSWAILGARRDGVSRGEVVLGFVARTVMMTAVVLSARMLGPVGRGQ
jgi:hypothetical protein